MEMEMEMEMEIEMEIVKIVESAAVCRLKLSYEIIVTKS